MPISVFVLVIVLTIGILAGVFWLAFRPRNPGREANRQLTLSWRYIILPVTVLLLVLMLSLFFYGRLPEQVAYHFKLDGTPDKWFSRGMILVLGLAPQVLLALLAVATAWGVTGLASRFKFSEETAMKPDMVLALMGNFIALPQLMAGFILLDIVGYNTYQRHIMPMTAFLFTILGLATIVLGMLLVFVFAKVKQAQESRRSK